MDLTKVDEILDKYQRDDSWLVMMMQDVQDVYNYLPREALKHLAGALDVSLSRVYNVATFYSSFTLAERGRHLIRLCDGTACHLRGADNLRQEVTRLLGIDDGQTTDDKMFTLEVVACLGACALAPVMNIDSKYYGKMTVGKVGEILDFHKNRAMANV